ncbi:MAG: hypothetical protein J1E16_04965 [Muribaculaceae bacterium]|nr:hypothetical protein [Muribaculaceae bacterium]
MKTSFYFFLWIIIYPLLALLHNPWVYQNSFIVALFVVWGLSWVLNRNMPETLRYERVSEMATILEEVYSGNIKAFRQRLSRMVTVEFITAIYLGVAFVFVLFSMVRGSADDWIALLIFGFFAFGAISRSVKLNQAYARIKQNPSPEECASVVEGIFRVDYSGYYSNRTHTTAEAMLPPQPRHFKAFQVFSLIIAIICALFGLFYLIMSIIILAENRSAEAISGGIMYFLYGSLAAYFGTKDSVTCFYYFKKEKRNKIS